MSKMSFHAANSSVTISGVPAVQEPCTSHLTYPVTSSEELVGFGVRCWIAGCRSKNFQEWQQCWSCYAQFFTPVQTRIAVTELACWARILESESAQPITINPLYEHEYSRDERMAVSIIAACQHQVCPALQACTEALIGDGDVKAAINAAKGFAYFLDDAGMTLSPSEMN